MEVRRREGKSARKHLKLLEGHMMEVVRVEFTEGNEQHQVQQIVYSPSDLLSLNW